MDRSGKKDGRGGGSGAGVGLVDEESNPAGSAGVGIGGDTGSGNGSGDGSREHRGGGPGPGSVTGSGTGSGSGHGSGTTRSGSRSGGGGHGRNASQKDSELSVGGGGYMVSEASAKQASESAYGSLQTSSSSRSNFFKEGSSISKSSGSSGLSCFQQGTVVGAAATAGGCSKGTDARQQPPNKALLPPLSSSDPPASGGVPCGAKKIGSHKLKAKGKVVAERVAAEMAGSIGSSTKAAGVESEGCGGNQISGSSNLGEQRQSSSGAHASVHENKAAKVAALSQALNFIDMFRKSQECNEEKGGPKASELNDLATNLQEASQGANPVTGKAFQLIAAMNANDQITDYLDREQGTDKGFSAAVSLNDGRVICTTTSIVAMLGYPKDMWNGRSFIDFVHPKDRATFNNQITRGVIRSHIKIQSVSMGAKHASQNHFFCRLRVYNGLKQGKYSIRNRGTTYCPFSISVRFKEIEKSAADATKSSQFDDGIGGHIDEDRSCGGFHSVCLVITAVVIKSAYSARNQKNGSFDDWVFVTRHSANCTFSTIEESAIPLLGYLPQDLENTDVFSHYHPDDLQYLKGVYENILVKQGKPFKSRPYRFKIQNGDYILLETVWSCFINPWSKKLEFVSGKHKVLEGPGHISIFGPIIDDLPPISEDAVVKCQNVLNETRLLLTDTVRRPTNDDTCVLGQNSSRRKELATVMGSLLEEIAKAETVPVDENIENTSILGTLGTAKEQISPRPEVAASNSPPSYNQLNYNANLARFFNSQPKTLTLKEVESMRYDAAKRGTNMVYGDSSSLCSTSSSRARSLYIAYDGENTSISAVDDTSGSGNQQGSKYLSQNQAGLGEQIGRKRGRNNAADKAKPDLKQGLGSSADSNDNAGGTGTTGDTPGTSEGVSAVHLSRHKRLQLFRHQNGGKDDVSGRDAVSGYCGDGESGSGDHGRRPGGIGDRRHPHQDWHHPRHQLGGRGGENVHSAADRTPLLTEELLQVHNKGMERQMIDHYKGTKTVDLLFMKNRRRPIVVMAKVAPTTGTEEDDAHGFYHNWAELDKTPGRVKIRQGHKVIAEGQNLAWRDATNACRDPAAMEPLRLAAVAPGGPSSYGLSFMSAGFPGGGKNQEGIIGHCGIQQELVAKGATPAQQQLTSRRARVPRRDPSELRSSIVARGTTTSAIPPLGAAAGATLSSSGLPPGAPRCLGVPAVSGSRSSASFAVCSGDQLIPAYLMAPLDSRSIPGHGNCTVGSSSAALLMPGSSPGATFIQQPTQVKFLSSSHVNPAALIYHHHQPLSATTLNRGASLNQQQWKPDHGRKVKKSMKQSATSLAEFQQSRTFMSPVSRDTSVKAEPGSILESNIESNASVSASIMDKLLSPGYCSSTLLQRKIQQEMTQPMSDDSTSSSLYSLIKSSDDFNPDGESSSRTSDSGEYQEVVARQQKPVLGAPAWLKDVCITPSLVYNYQVKLKDPETVLMEDQIRLRNMYQPKLVNRQLETLMEDLNRVGLDIRPLLDEETASSSLDSSADENSFEFECVGLNRGGPRVGAPASSAQVWSAETAVGSSNGEPPSKGALMPQKKTKKNVRMNFADMNAYLFEADAPLPHSKECKVVRSKVADKVDGDEAKQVSNSNKKKSSLASSTQSSGGQSTSGRGCDDDDKSSRTDDKGCSSNSSNIGSSSGGSATSSSFSKAANSSLKHVAETDTSTSLGSSSAITVDTSKDYFHSRNEEKTSTDEGIHSKEQTDSVGKSEEDKQSGKMDEDSNYSSLAAPCLSGSVQRPSSSCTK